MSDEQIFGWHLAESRSGKEQRLAYRCACCRVHVILAPEEHSVHCCGRIVTYEESGWFAPKLPVERAARYAMSLVS